jgi:hypothetical protein
MPRALCYYDESFVVSDSWFVGVITLHPRIVVGIIARALVLKQKPVGFETQAVMAFKHFGRIALSFQHP